MPIHPQFATDFRERPRPRRYTIIKTSKRKRRWPLEGYRSTTDLKGFDWRDSKEVLESYSMSVRRNFKRRAYLTASKMARHSPVNIELAGAVADLPPG
ncbi:hypothetical protein EVAR_49480_1 [Eumeta japonica]|uniref:Uncharacterized protein n=1 Tax=Eumeta variegata TaxID=151549 RepID=A0A4C1VXB9_EUMVA|nr:hypothetical protein EVAR_49480_1 [Eumeta japonica]